MNCFNNNTPKLSSSDRIRDMKSQSIFKSNVEDFKKRTSGRQTKCKNYNGKIGFYRNGELRNVRSYKTLLDLNRGSALCVDGAYKNNPNFNNKNGFLLQRGLDSCKRKKSVINSVKITNGRDSVFNVFNGITLPDFSEALFKGFPVLNSFNIVNGKFIKYDYNTTDTDFNQLDPSGSFFMTLDPSNNLFSSGFCPADINNINEGSNKYLKHAHATQYVVVEGIKEEGTIEIGDIAVAGYDSLVDIENPASENIDKYLTGVGTVIKICKLDGAVYQIYILINYGIFPSPQLLPIYSAVLKRKIGDPNQGIAFYPGALNYPLLEDPVMFGKGGKYTAIHAAGIICKKNLMFGNNTVQNYLVSYDPTSKGVKFNIDTRLYTDFKV